MDALLVGSVLPDVELLDFYEVDSPAYHPALGITH